METKQLYLGEKPEQICVKIYIIHNADELELLTLKNIMYAYCPFLKKDMEYQIHSKTRQAPKIIFKTSFFNSNNSSCQETKK